MPKCDLARYVAPPIIGGALLLLFGFSGQLFSGTQVDIIRYMALIPMAVLVFSIDFDAVSASTLALCAWTAILTAGLGLFTWGISFALLSMTLIFLLARKAARWRFVRAGLLCFGIATTVFTAYSVFNPQYDAFGRAIFFTGGKNSLALVALPLVYILVRFWNPYRWPGHAAKWICLSTAIVLPFVGGSGTGQVTTVLLILAVFAPNIRHKWAVWFAGLMLFNLAVVSGWLIARSQLASDVVVDGLSKSTDFTARGRIWDVAWAQISVDPLGQGRGYAFLEERILGITEAHNSIFEISAASGLIGLGLYCIIVGSTMRSAGANDSLGFRLVCVALIVGVVESYVNHLGFWLLIGMISAAPTFWESGMPSSQTQRVEVLDRG